MDENGSVQVVRHPTECWVRMLHAASREIWLLGSGKRFTVTTHGTSVPCRIIVHRSSLGCPDRLAELRRRARRGETIRVVADLPSEMVIVDRAVALLPLTACPSSEVLLVRGPVLVATLVAAYETWWQGAVPLAALDSSGRGPGDPRLMILLAAGLTDKSIARQLGIGQRTVQRQVRALLEGLRSQTRFQAGLRVGRLRLLDPDPSVNENRGDSAPW